MTLTYQPTTFTPAGSVNYFQALGILDSDMEMVINDDYTFSTPDATYASSGGLSQVGNVIQTTGLSQAWSAWDFSATQEVFGLVFIQMSLGSLQSIGFTENPAAAGADVDTGYNVGSGAVTENIGLQKNVTSGSWATLASDASIYRDDVYSQPMFGIAFHAAKTPDVADKTALKVYIQMGASSQWFPVLEYTDESSAIISFESAYLRTGTGQGSRFTTPFYVWRRV